MKKVCYIIFIFILIISLSTSVSLGIESERIIKDFVNEELINRQAEEMPKELKENTLRDYTEENKKRETAYEKGIKTWLEPYMNENVPENQRVKEYIMTGFGNNVIEGDKLKSNIYLDIVPYSEDSVWSKEFSGILFATFGIYDGEYLLEKASIYPENYDKFLEEFEKYQENAPAKTEIIEVQAEKVGNLETAQVEKMSTVIWILSSIVLVLVICYIAIRNIYKNNK